MVVSLLIPRHFLQEMESGLWMFRAVIRKDSYPVPSIFKLLAEKGQIEEQMMYNTFNMGLGMVVAVDEADVDKTMAAIKAAGDQPYVVGTIENGEKGVTLC